MSFEDQLQRQFDNMSLQPIKMTTNLAHLYADFAELLALFSNDAYFTAADLIDQRRLPPPGQTHGLSARRDHQDTLIT